MAGHGTPAEGFELSRMARLIIKGRRNVQTMRMLRRLGLIAQS
jgi:hypothetical protein